MASRIIEDLTGFYEVAGKKYYNKLEAFSAALPNGWWPHWNFNEEEFSQHTWDAEPTETLNELYRQRALDIRSRYDYVIVWFSGGSDSDNIVRSFLENGIHIDEIWHRSSFERISRADKGIDNTNQANESRHAAIPLAKEYQKLSPTTKIRFFDAMDQGIDIWTEGERDPYETNYFNPLLPAKEQAYRFNEHSEHLKTCKVVGIDKPRVKFQDGKYWLIFQDDFVHTNVLQSRLQDTSSEQDEAFYWHPNAAKLLIKQGHVVKKFFKENPSLHWVVETYEHNSQAKEVYEKIIRSIIYSYWNANTFQTQKASNNIAHEEFFWFYQDMSNQATQNWFKTALSYAKEVKSVYSSISEDQHNYTITKQGFATLPGAYSKAYCLGS
jgi:hypothetical protein